MKIYALYTKSHEILFENYFLKTLPKEFELVTKIIPQDCPTAHFYKEGWDKTCFRKIEFYEEACKENQGELFVFSDVDVQFFGDIKQTLIDEIGDFDIACQNDSGNYYCSGFWICRGNERTLNLFAEMKKNYRSEDQTTLNDQIHLVKSKFLSRKFFTIAHLSAQVWNGQQFNLPYHVLMHHANWTEGRENKIRLLELVKEKNKLINE